jgi:hypothetical protein
MKRPLALLLLLLGATCAAPRALTHGELWRELRALEMRLPAAVTCPETCRIAEAICEAATKICAIAAERPDDPDLAERCRAARASCEDARDRCRRCG